MNLPYSFQKVYPCCTVHVDGPKFVHQVFQLLSPLFGIDFENKHFFCFDCRIGNNIFSLDDFAFGSGDTLFLLRSTFLDVAAADEGSPRHGSVDVFFLFKVLVSSSFVPYGLGVLVTVTVLLSDERR